MLNSQLHDDVVIEILLRLPVKSLIRFKRVSQSWRSLISSHLFASLHHKQTSIKRIFVSISRDDVASLDCDRSSFTCRDPRLYRSLKSSFPVSTDEFYVVGSSNGLICVSSGMPELEFDLWIWNPSTSESIKIVPDLKHKIRNFYIHRVGFGYDEWGDDYKIVVATFGSHNWRDYDVINHIYSSKTGTWRSLANTEGLNLLIGSQRIGLLVNGALHWQLGIEEERETKIIALDLAEERFRVFGLPPGVGRVYGRQIGILNELLCFSANYYSSGQASLSIWAMKEYGVETSWAKLFTVGDPATLFLESLPLCSTECGEIICTGPRIGLALCHPEKDTLLRSIYKYSRATVYVETLISPKLLLRAKEKKNDLDGKGYRKGEEKESKL